MEDRNCKIISFNVTKSINWKGTMLLANSYFHLFLIFGNFYKMLMIIILNPRKRWQFDGLIPCGSFDEIKKQRMYCIFSALKLEKQMVKILTWFSRKLRRWLTIQECAVFLVKCVFVLVDCVCIFLFKYKLPFQHWFYSIKYENMHYLGVEKQ